MQNPEYSWPSLRRPGYECCKQTSYKAIKWLMNNWPLQVRAKLSCMLRKRNNYKYSESQLVQISEVLLLCLWIVLTTPTRNRNHVIIQRSCNYYSSCLELVCYVNTISGRRLVPGWNVEKRRTLWTEKQNIILDYKKKKKKKKKKITPDYEE